MSLLPATPREAKKLGLTKYFTGKPCPKGHVVERITSCGSCTMCCKQTADIWMEKNRKRHSKKVRAWQKANPLRTLLTSIKRRAHKSNLECTITIDDLVIPEFCPILGTKLQFGGTTVNERKNSPSVDRKNNSKGYTPDNIQIISNHANFIKAADVTAEELIKVAQWMNTHCAK